MTVKDDNLKKPAPAAPKRTTIPVDEEDIAHERPR